VRGLRKNIGFSLIVISVLALGIGANTAFFSIIDRVLLHPFPFRSLDRLVEIRAVDAKGQETNNKPEDMNFFATHVHSFERVEIWRWQNFVLTGVDNTDSVFALEVSQNLFDTLGVRPALGRTFLPGEFESAAPAVVVISDRLWRKHFHADPGIVGRQVLLDGKGYTVVGIMGPGFVFTNPAHQAWIPFKPSTVIRGELHAYFSNLARLRSGISIAQAQHEMEAVTPGLPPNPDRDKGWHARLRPFTEQFTGPYRRALVMLWGAVGLVLLIACANAANLLLARASERRREFAIRASLGADSVRLARQVITETLTLGLAAGVAGVALSFGLIRLLAKLFVAKLPVPGLDSVSMNGMVLAATAGLVLLTTLLCATPACASLWRSDLTAGIQAAGRSVSSSRAANRTRAVLLSFEVALSLMLLVGAGLMLHTLDRLMRVHLGFEPEHVLVAGVSAPAQLETKEAKASHYSRVLDQVRSLPGVLNAGVATVLPFGGLSITSSLTAEGIKDTNWRSYGIYLREISPGYFPALGVRLLRGRDFNAGDTARSESVVMINDELARHYWPGQDPLGKRVSRSDEPKPGEWSTVVGVVESIKHRSLRTGSDAELYLPYTQSLIGAKYTYLVLRTQGDPLSVVSALRKRIHDVDPGQPVTSVETMRTMVVNSAAEVRFHTLLLEIFAGLALGLAVAGIFAVVSYAVSRRTREIGIRGALGATPTDVVRLVIGIAMRPVALGACVGMAGALAATRMLESELFETAPADPLVFAVVVVLLISTAVAAASIPAWRATRIDPAEVLRAE
jgi:putative ABC transport system permease protein